MPEPEAWFEAQLTRAFPNSSEHEKDYHISLVKAYARIHATALLHHEPVIWQDPRLSSIGRHLRKVAHLVRKIREHGLECDL